MLTAFSGVDADLSKLRVLDAVIKETLRLHGPAPIGTVRYVSVTGHDALLLMYEPQRDDLHGHENEEDKAKWGGVEEGGGKDRTKGKEVDDAAITQCMMSSWRLGLRLLACLALRLQEYVILCNSS